MAKSPIDAFSKFNDILDKKVKSKIELVSFVDINEYIDTGNYALNAQLSGSLFGGYPNTRSTSIAGDSGCLQKSQKVRIYKFKNPNLSEEIHNTIKS